MFAHQRALLLAFSWCYLLFTVHCLEGSYHPYAEQLTLRPLPGNLLQASFEFESQSDGIERTEFYSFSDEALPDKYAHYSIFPRSLGQIIEQTHIRELHLRFAQGWWDAEKWGSLPHNGTYAGGIGVEMWAWIEADTQNEAEARWKGLANSLSGLFCASLNFLDSAQTTFPVKSFQPFSSELRAHDSKGLFLLHGALPAEPVCTENLTPFIKLLPCKGRAGISSLLDGHSIFDTQWQAMSIDVSPICNSSDNTCRYKMVQNIEAVIDVEAALARRKSGVAKPIPFENLKCDESKSYNSEYHCFPKSRETNIQWKISEIFGRNIEGSCPLALNDIHVKVEASQNWQSKLVEKQLEETPKPDNATEVHLTEVEIDVTQDHLLVLPRDLSLDLILSSEDSSIITPVENPSVFVERSFTGYGQKQGGLRSVFQNPSETDSVDFVYFETIPWYMRVYLHTLELNVKELGSDTAGSTSSLADADIIKDVFFRRAIDRQQPMQIEIQISLPPKTWAALSYDFDKSLLFIEEYPPDANHGFNIAPAVLTSLGNKTFSMRTTSLLLSLPTPDFSMPYNVIILTCTVMALSFGTIFNLLIKKVVTEEEAEKDSADRPMAKLTARIKGIVGSIFATKESRRGPFPYEEKRKIIHRVD